MITKDEKEKLESMVESEWWLVLERYLKLEIKNIVKRCLVIGGNEPTMSTKDVELVRLSQLNAFISKPLNLISTYSENKPMWIDEFNDNLNDMDWDKLSELLQ